MQTKTEKAAAAGAGFFEACPPRAGCICAGAKVLGRAVGEAGEAAGRLLALERGWRQVAPEEGVYCICLQERPDRFRAACDEAHRWGLCRVMQFYRPCKPTDAELASAGVKLRGFFGSWEAHRAVAQRALDLRLKRVLIFEDDFFLLPAFTSPNRLCQIARDIDALDASAEWELFFLGHMPFYGWPIDRRARVFRTHSCWIHAYLLNRAGQRILAGRSYVDEARSGGRGEQTLDTWLRGATRQYAAFPMIAAQSCVGSDNLPTAGATGGRYARLVEWWTGVHKGHSRAIEIAVLVALPILVIALACLVAIWLLWAVARLLAPPHLSSTVSAAPVA